MPARCHFPEQRKVSERHPAETVAETHHRTRADKYRERRGNCREEGAQRHQKQSDPERQLPALLVRISVVMKIAAQVSRVSADCGSAAAPLALMPRKVSPKLFAMMGINAEDNLDAK